MQIPTNLAIAAVLLAACVTAARGAEPDASQQYLMLLNSYDEEGGARTFAKRFIALAEQHPDDPVAVDALLWAIKRVKGHADTERAVKLLHAHIQRKSLGKACPAIAGAFSAESEKLLRKLLEKSPHPEVRAQAGYYLAELLDTEAYIVEQLKADPKSAPRLLQYYGKAYGKHLTSLKPAQLNLAREAINEQLLKSYPAFKVGDAKIGESAKKKLFLLRRLSSGKVAPEIVGEDIFGTKMKLSDFRGQVVMLSFWGHW